MKKRYIFIISVPLSVVLLWAVLSLSEYYKAGQSLSLGFYLKNISANKLLDLMISQITVLLLFFYYAFYKLRKEHQTE